MQWKPSFTYGHKLTYIHTSCVCCPSWIKFGMKNLNVMLLSIRENQCRQVHAFVRGLNKITFSQVMTSFLVSPSCPFCCTCSSLGQGMMTFHKYHYCCNVYRYYDQIITTLLSKIIDYFHCFFFFSPFLGNCHSGNSEQVMY